MSEKYAVMVDAPWLASSTPRPVLSSRNPQPGVAPLYRTTLSRLCRFPNLAAVSAKTYDLAVESTRESRYATGEQDIACLGGSSKVNVWRPITVSGLQLSFSQQWYTAVGATGLQSVECGWQVDPSRYGGDINPHFFIFSTINNYNYKDHPEGNFYNTERRIFAQVQNPYILPGSALLFSQTSGTQVEYSMTCYLTSSASGPGWWIYFDGNPIGMIPTSWFEGGPMATGATRATFGGETGIIVPPMIGWPSMGSGQHAQAGFGNAAYQRDCRINLAGGGAYIATLAEAGSVSGSCYSIQITNNGSSSDWGTYLFFGGPGGGSC